MKLAFLINNYYPYGGMEKNFLRIVKACLTEGFDLHIFTMSWQGEKPEGATLTLVPFTGWSNHGRARSFVNNFHRQFAPSAFDLVVGFNRMPGLDLYYNADVCYVLDVAKRRGLLSRLTPRYRAYCQFERAVFGRDSKTHIMYLSGVEKKNYIKVYGTPEERFHYLPPGIDKERIIAANTAQNRRQVRFEFGVSDDDFMLLMIGSDFRRKGVARALVALAGLDEEQRCHSQLFIIGQGKARKYVRLAGKLGVTEQVHFLGGRQDVPRFLAAADLLLHPAVSENTGNVILEAMVAGCAVLASGTCGYGFHVEKAEAGLVLAEPFRQEEMNEQLQAMLDTERLRIYGNNGASYVDRVDLYSRPEAAVALITALVAQKKAGV